MRYRIEKDELGEKVEIELNKDEELLIFTY